jgi:hypothetical protein
VLGERIGFRQRHPAGEILADVRGGAIFFSNSMNPVL